MQERDVLIGCIIGSISGFWIAQCVSTLSSWSGTSILANCSNPTYCSLIMPASIAAMLIMISLVLYEILKPKKRH